MKQEGRFRAVANLLCCWLFINAVSADVKACSYSSNPTNIGQSFVVSVNDRGRPVEGLEIELTMESRKVDRTIAVLKTDVEGRVEFKRIRAGLYFVGIKHPAFGHSEEIRVMPHPPKGSPNGFTFEWPGWKPLSASAMSGSVMGSARTDRGILLDTTQPVFTRVTGAKLTLLKAVSDETLETQVTSESGSFEFHPVPPGLYLLRVETPVLEPPRWTYPRDGYVPVEVDSAATFDSLDIVLDNAICGELGWSRYEKADSTHAQTH